MDTLEGTLRVLRISRDNEPEPWTYELSFEPYTASEIPRPCDVIGDEQLARTLRDGLGLTLEVGAQGGLRERAGAVLFRDVAEHSSVSRRSSRRVAAVTAA